MPSKDPFNSARLKIKRARAFISEATQLIDEKKPFKYIVESDAQSGRRALMAIKDEELIDEISAICGDAVHNLRSALDHGYAAVVGKHLTTNGQRRNMQFPFSEKSNGLEKACQNRHANKVSQDFLDELILLKPHGGPDGNALLYFMHALDLPDKHSHLIPTAYYLKYNGWQMRKLVFDYPGHDYQKVGFSNNGIDVVWNNAPLALYEWIKAGSPSNTITRQELDIPVEIVFDGYFDNKHMICVPTLNNFVDEAERVISVISKYT